MIIRCIIKCKYKKYFYVRLFPKHRHGKWKLLIWHKMRTGNWTKWQTRTTLLASDRSESGDGSIVRRDDHMSQQRVEESVWSVANRAARWRPMQLWTLIRSHLKICGPRTATDVKVTDADREGTLTHQSYCYRVCSAIGIITSSVCLSVCLSVCNAVHSGIQGRCTELKVVPACSQQASSYLSLRTLLL